MKNVNGKFLYLGILFLFKLMVGGILLITSWDALSLSNDPLWNISLLMALSFFPATFSRTLFNKLKAFSLHHQISINFISMFFLFGLEYVFLLEKSPNVFIVHFLLWISIFLTEIIFEKWFVGLSNNFNINESRRLSGISTTAGQMGLIVGPILMIILKQYSYSTPYYFCTLILLTLGIVPLLFKLPFQNDEHRNIGHKSKKNPSIIYTVAFSLIWPTLAIFNTTAPILAKSQFESINVVGVMEFLIGLAMAIIGFSHIFTMRYMDHFKRMISVFFLLVGSTSLIFLFPNSLKVIYISTFIVGLTFGYLRIELRAFLSHKFSSEEAGDIIARANSWSGPLVLIYCGIFYFESSLRISQEVSVVFPLSFIILASIMCYLLISDSKFIKENL